MLWDNWMCDIIHVRIKYFMNDPLPVRASSPKKVIVRTVVTPKKKFTTVILNLIEGTT